MWAATPSRLATCGRKLVFGWTLWTHQRRSLRLRRPCLVNERCQGQGQDQLFGTAWLVSLVELFSGIASRPAFSRIPPTMSSELYLHRTGKEL
ncbi:hypothetical protein U1Q18_016741 [Sarracenia purpurea var. burkii]